MTLPPVPSIVVDREAPLCTQYLASDVSDAFARLANAVNDDLTVLSAIVADGDKGDITLSSSGATWTIDSDVVSNTKLANMTEGTVKGRASGAGTGDPTDLTATQVGTIIAPAWSTHTPTVTAGAGTFTSVSGTIRYYDVGKIRFFHCKITITTNGTAASFVAATLPSGAPEGSLKYLGAGRTNAVSGKGLIGVFSSGFASNSILIFNYDGTYPGADGEVLDVGGSYELA